MEGIKIGKYIYCIIKCDKDEVFEIEGVGGSNKLYSICFDDISAVVSDSPIIKYSASRENFLNHEKPIEYVMKKHSNLLPVRFATIAEDEAKVKKILEKEYDKFKDLLNKIEGKKELGLKAIFEEIIYSDILKKYDDIRAIKERIANLPVEKTYYQRIEIGRIVESALEKEKEICKNEILNILSSLAVEVKTNNTYGERMILNSAFLVERAKEAEFDKRLEELTDKYKDKIKFKYIGTIPPFNFVNLVIETGEY